MAEVELLNVVELVTGAVPVPDALLVLLVLVLLLALVVVEEGVVVVVVVVVVELVGVLVVVLVKVDVVAVVVQFWTSPRIVEAPVPRLDTNVGLTDLGRLAIALLTAVAALAASPH